MPKAPAGNAPKAPAGGQARATAKAGAGGAAAIKQAGADAKQAAAAKEAQKPRPREPQAWEEDGFPRMEQRRFEVARLDPEQLAKMRASAKKKLQDSKGPDPATLTRKWDYSFCITGVENTTPGDWNIFMAVKMGSIADHRNWRARIRHQYNFTKSYIVKSSQKKQFAKIEKIFNERWEGSYKELQQNEVVVNIWQVSSTNFNRLLGTARKTLYELANDSVYQTMLIKPNVAGIAKHTFDIGMVYIRSLVAEVLQFTIVASNWQFQPRAELGPQKGPRKLRIEMPTANNGAMDSFTSGSAHGPRFCWPEAGRFTYNGTRVSLSTEAVFISVMDAGKIQGKAVLGLGGAGDYPIVMGTVKQITQNVNAYVQGRVAGNFQVTARSKALKEGTHDEDSSIPPPEQPPDSAILNHLSPSLQYLVVELLGAQSLPVADSDSGSSNPFCRVKYDGNVQKSPVVMDSLSPTWSHTFYMPVRLVDKALTEDATHYKRLLPLEMKSKGLLELEIWHMDTSVPTEFLGSLSFDLFELLHCREQERALCERATRTAANAASVGGAAVGSAESAVAMGVHPALSKKFSTRVYEGRRLQLGGSWLQSATSRATISFDCYFIPDFASDFKFPKQEMEQKCRFEESFKRWDREWPEFNEAYSAWFPDGPQNRRFLAKYFEAGGSESPLPRLVVPLALPASLMEPMRVQHWVRCMEFSVPPRQRSVGQISNWQHPQDMLAVRRGSVQDHAVLLCCALLGLGKQAYVCKGTVQGGRDHAWVMTREQQGTVTFWETTTGGKFHLPRRWLGGAYHSDATKGKVEQRWRASQPNMRWRETADQRRSLTRSEVLASMDELVNLPIAPWRQLCADNFVVAVPYESVEVVFNGHQLWGNRGNHHPACVFYDMEDDPRSWMPLVVESEQRALLQAMAVPVGPAMSKNTVDELQDIIETEIKDCVCFMRVRSGHETLFNIEKDDEVLQECLEGYLQMLESECQLDADWCYTRQDQQVKPWGRVPSPYNKVEHVSRCRDEWGRYWKMRKAMGDARCYLPVKENHVLSGVPLHIACTDLKEIRKNLLACGPIQEYFNLPMDDVVFFVCAKVFPMPSSVNSVWIFLGAEVPLTPEKIYELATYEAHQRMAAHRRQAAEEDTWAAD